MLSLKKWRKEKAGGRRCTSPASTPVKTLRRTQSSRKWRHRWQNSSARVSRCTCAWNPFLEVLFTVITVDVMPILNVTCNYRDTQHWPRNTNVRLTVKFSLIYNNLWLFWKFYSDIWPQLQTETPVIEANIHQMLPLFRSQYAPQCIGLLILVQLATASGRIKKGIVADITASE